MCGTNFRSSESYILCSGLQYKFTGNLRIILYIMTSYTRFVNLQHRLRTEPFTVMYFTSILISTRGSIYQHWKRFFDPAEKRLLSPILSSKQALCKRSNRRWDKSTSNIHETEEVPQALRFRGVMCTTKTDPHM